MGKVRIIKINKTDLYAVTCSFFLTVSAFIYTYQSEKAPFFITNALIIFICSNGLLFQSKFPFSLKDIFYIFFLIFFGFIPLNDIYYNNQYWGGSKIDDIYYVIANLYILFSLICFMIGYKLYKRKYFNFNSSNIYINNDSNSIYKALVILFFSFFIFLFILINYNYSFADLFLRTKESDILCMGIQCQSSAVGSELFDYLIRPITFMFFLIYWNFRPELRMKWLSTVPGLIGISLFFLAVISNLPTALPRFLAATLYIPLIILMFKKIFIYRYLFSTAIIAGLFIIFPFLDNFRYFYTPDFRLFINFDFLSTGNFDAYQNFVRLISIDLVTYGHQLLGVILFWLPRAYWPTKPDGSGFLLAHLENLSLDNISFPLIAEGYVNFGILGIAIFFVLLGIILSIVDKAFWRNNKFNSGDILFIPYLLSFGLLFMMLRGNLLSAFAYSIGVLSSYFLSFSIVYFILRSNK